MCCFPRRPEYPGSARRLEEKGIKILLHCDQGSGVRGEAEVSVFTPACLQEESPSIPPRTLHLLPPHPPGPGLLGPYSQDTLSLMVFRVLRPVPGKVTRQARLVPWSWGCGVRVSTEEWGLLGCREVRATPVQEKVGGVPISQAHGTAQVKLVGRPDARVPWTWMSGVSVRAGEAETQTQDWRGDPRVPLRAVCSPASCTPGSPPRMRRQGSPPTLP